MASITVTDRSSRGVRAEGLARFIAEIVLSTPSTEKAAGPGPQTPELTQEGEAFVARCRSVLGDVDAAPSAAATQEYIQLVLTHLPKVLESSASEAEVEASFQVLLSFVGSSSFASADEVTAIVRRISDVVAASTKSRSAMRLRILSSLFSGCENTDGKHALFEQILNFALASSQVGLIQGSLSAAPEWFVRWALPAPQQAALFTLLADCWTAIGNSTQAFQSLLSTLSVAAAGEPRNAVAARAVAFLFTNTKLALEANLESIKAVAALRESEGHKLAWDLLQHCLHPEPVAFGVFAETNAAYLQRLGVTPVAALETVRVLAIAAVLKPAAETHAPVSYSEIASKLNVPAANVEALVATGATAGLYQAQLDEVEQVVVASDALDLVFGRHEWEALRDRLSGMSLHARELLEALTAETTVDA